MARSLMVASHLFMWQQAVSHADRKRCELIFVHRF